MTRVLSTGLLLCGLLSAYAPTTEGTYPYYGTKIGPLTQLHHGVSGEVYAVDSRTVFVRNFNYDGEAPSAYFYVGSTPKPSNDGAYRLRDERGSSAPLTKRYRNKDITLSLPEGKTLRDIKWFAVWCDDFAVNFGDVKITNNLDFPRPQKLAPLNGVHGVSSDSIVIVDAQTLLVPNFSYDGDAPDAKFWVGRGQKPSPQGLRIPDENGKETPLRRYDRKTIVLTLPGDLTVFDIGHFGVWCEAFTVDFGHIRIPEGLNVPPSLKMLGISPQSKLNCEVLYDDLAFEVRWAVAGESVVVQLVAKLEDGEYMSFGISPNPEHTEMVGADVVVAWVDKETGKGYAYDYYLDAKSQCSGGKGSCPDTRIEENTNSIRLLNAAMVNGYSIVTYQRPLKATDKLDLPIRTNGSQAIDWAIGPLNQRSEVSFHSKYTKGDQFINFGRQPTWNCPMPEGESRPAENENPEEYYDRRPQAQKRTTTAQPDADRRGGSRPARRPVPAPKPVNTNEAWEIPPIQCDEPEDGVLYAQLGPTGGKHGYPAITGHVGWGISWYINGLLIPEIHVVRGKTYTFVVEGGIDPEYTAKYHPFYITDDPIGGYEHKTEEEKAGIQIYAGVHRSRNGKVTPTGVGRLCNWTPDMDGPPADEYQSFGAYQRTLTLKCDPGEPGVISWTPDKNTPDTVYYHCFTHRYLGWKIHVHDTCDSKPQASEIDEVFVEPEEDDFVAEASIRHETKVLPTQNFLLQHEKDLIKNHNMDGSPPKISFELSKSSEITKLISDGIRAAEALEESITKNQPYPTTPTFIQSTSPDNFKIETVVINNLTSPQIQIPQDHLVLPNPEISTFLRPPQNPSVFRPAKIPHRRPPPPSIHHERRPSIHSQRPVIVPQPSVIVNHYRKQIPPIIRPFVKEKPFPIQPIASVLLLGQTTELGRGGIQRQNEPLLKAKPKPGSILVPYVDSAPQDTKKNFAIVRSGSGLKTKKPYMRLPVMPEKVSHKPAIFKKPFDIKEDMSSETLRPAINTGFQPDSVVVEGGFRPILRRRNDDDQEFVESEERVIRREDDVSDIDEALEKDALFFNKEEESQPFEPMFIPSPPDNANATIIRKAINRPKPLRLGGDLMDMEVEEGDDKIAVAAERLDTYYLPPETKMRKGVVVPDGAVVTYDGKAVLDMSLVNSAPSRLHATESPRGMSKTEQLVRSTPQFGPFRGEMPPPVPDYLPSDAPQSNLMASKNNQKLPNLGAEYSNPLVDNVSPISTKLSLLKTKNKRENSSEA